MLNRASVYPRAIFRTDTWATALIALAFILVASAILLLPSNESKAPSGAPEAISNTSAPFISETSGVQMAGDTAAIEPVLVEEAAAEPVIAQAVAVEPAIAPAVVAEPVVSQQTAVQPATVKAAAEPAAPSAAPAAAVAAAQPAPVIVVEAPAPVAAAPTAAGRIALIGASQWDAVSLANVQAAVAALPSSVQAKLGNPAFGQVKILVNSQGRTASGFQPYGQAANFFSTNESTNEVVLYPQQSAFTILHELGHAYNLRFSPAGNYASVLAMPEMQSFMAATGWVLLTPVAQVAGMYDHSQVSLSYNGAPVWTSMSRNDPLEDFANSFATYFLNKADLAARSPERYAWFVSHFGF